MKEKILEETTNTILSGVPLIATIGIIGGLMKMFGNNVDVEELMKEFVKGILEHYDNKIEEKEREIKRKDEDIENLRKEKQRLVEDIEDMNNGFHPCNRKRGPKKTTRKKK